MSREVIALLPCIMFYPMSQPTPPIALPVHDVAARVVQEAHPPVMALPHHVAVHHVIRRIHSPLLHACNNATIGPGGGGFLQDMAFSDDQGFGDMDMVGSGSVSPQAMATVGVNRKMAGNATVYTVHIGLEHSHVGFFFLKKFPTNLFHF